MSRNHALERRQPAPDRAQPGHSYAAVGPSRHPPRAGNSNPGRRLFHGPTKGVVW